MDQAVMRPMTCPRRHLFRLIGRRRHSHVLFHLSCFFANLCVLETPNIHAIHFSVGERIRACASVLYTVYINGFRRQQAGQAKRQLPRQFDVLHGRNHLASYIQTNDRFCVVGVACPATIGGSGSSTTGAEAGNAKLPGRNGQCRSAQG